MTTIVDDDHHIMVVPDSLPLLSQRPMRTKLPLITFVLSPLH
jgi:hypothetical protein